jgi:hypothetical protein
MNEAMSIEIDLAQVIGLIALLLTILIWRSKSTLQILKKAEHYLRIYRAGFYSGKAFVGLSLRVTQLLSQFVAIVLCLYVAYVTFNYFGRIESLFDPRISLDIGIQNRIWALAESLKDKIVRFSFVAGALFIVDWFFGLLVTFMNDQKLEAVLQEAARIPFHVYSVSPSGRSMPAAMWQDRIESVQRAGGEYGLDKIDIQEILEEDKWRRNWSTWSRCVLLYRDLASKQVTRFSNNGDSV